MRQQTRTILFLCCVVSLVLAAQSAFARVEKLIVGGVEAGRGEFPFIVSLHDWGGHFCGGSLIKKNWVLTAGHCVSNGSRPKVYIGLHDQRETRDAELFETAEVIRHPKYDHGTIDYDYALIRLNGESRFEPVELNRTEITKSRSETDFTVAGWGVLKESQYDLPDLLQKVDVPFVDKQRCSEAYPDGITDRMICAGYDEGGKDSCQGDSGGPMVYYRDGKPVLAGVVSWGEGCARARKYGVYSKVNAVIDWIEESTK